MKALELVRKAMKSQLVGESFTWNSAFGKGARLTAIIVFLRGRGYE
jgi:hypothetical protein